MFKEINMAEISTEVISGLAKDVAVFIAKKLEKKYKDIVSREDIDYGTAFEKYLL